MNATKKEIAKLKQAERRQVVKELRGLKTYMLKRHGKSLEVGLAALTMDAVAKYIEKKGRQIAAGGALLLALLAMPYAAQARSISDVELHFVPNQVELLAECARAGQDMILYGCFWPDGTDRVYVRTDLPSEKITFTFWHELGHFYMQDRHDFSVFDKLQEAQTNVARTQLEEAGVQRALIDQLLGGANKFPNYEFAANEFARWNLDPTSVTAEEAKVFVHDIKN